MANQIAWVSLAVLLVAAGAGWLLARRITRRLVRLARHRRAASDVDGSASTAAACRWRDATRSGRLSASFNTMLARLAAARDAQDRLVQDAAHELRTPLTSLRTNASVLRRFAELSADARGPPRRRRPGRDAASCRHLVDELVELALARRGDEPEQPVDLARGRPPRRRPGAAPHRPRRSTSTPTARSASAASARALERAVGNLLENAAKFDRGRHGADRRCTSAAARSPSPTGARDRAADAGRVFDRFYRADTARGLPGSGLGLAIVRDVAAGPRRHGLRAARGRAAAPRSASPSTPVASSRSPVSPPSRDRADLPDTHLHRLVVPPLSPPLLLGGAGGGGTWPVLICSRIVSPGSAVPLRVLPDDGAPGARLSTRAGGDLPPGPLQDRAGVVEAAAAHVGHLRLGAAFGVAGVGRRQRLHGLAVQQRLHRAVPGLRGGLAAEDVPVPARERGPGPVAERARASWSCRT